MPHLLPRAALAGLAALTLAPSCKSPPAAQRSLLGPFSADRYEDRTAAGARLDCYLLGADSIRPVRLCGEGSPTPGFQGMLFVAAPPAPGGRFQAAVGEPLPEGLYLLRPGGASVVDAWPLGRMTLREWLAGGKVLLGVEVADDRHTRVRLIDPQARSERTFDVGQTRAGDNLALVRAPGDAAVLLVQRLGGDELLLIRDPAGNAEVAMADASDDKSPGNRKFHQRGEAARQNGGQWKPTAADLAGIGWKRDAPHFEGAPLGPFEIPPTLR